MSSHNANIINMLRERKQSVPYEKQTLKRLFSALAETKSVKDFTREDVEFLFPEIVRSSITVEFQKNGHIFASTHGDHTVKIVDFTTGKILQILSGHPRTPWAVRFHPRNPDILVSGCIGSRAIVWNWKKGEILASTDVAHNVMISSLDWHPTQDLILITCGTTVFIWDYHTTGIINLFPHNVLKYQFAYFYGEDRDFIASHENLVNHNGYKTFTITRYKLVTDKYTNQITVCCYGDISKNSTVNCANGIYISKYGDYAYISTCEQEASRQMSQPPPSHPDIFPQLTLNNTYVVPANPPQLPPLPPAHNRSLNHAFSTREPQTPTPSNSSIFGNPNPINNGPLLSRGSAPTVSTPPPIERRPSLTPPPIPRLQEDDHFSLFGLPRPNQQRQFPEEPTLRPQAIPILQEVVYSTPQRKVKRYIVKISLLRKSFGKVLSKHEIPKDSLVSSIQASPSGDFVLASYRNTSLNEKTDFTSTCFHIYRQSDWRLYYKATLQDDNANIAVWSPLMDGLVVATERGKLIIYRSNVLPLSRSKLRNSTDMQLDEEDDEDQITE